MCSEYEYYARLKKVDESIGFTMRVPGRFLTDDKTFHVRLYDQAPIIVLGNDGNPEIQMAQFSVKPPGTKYSTFNARLADWDEQNQQFTRIFDKWTWKKPFIDRRCLVPMTSFYEPIYLGENAGSIMTFKNPNDEVLLAAGIWDECKHPKVPDESYLGFAFIMHTALDVVLTSGHHRSPVFLRPRQALEYLVGEMSEEERFRFLLKERYEPQLVSSQFRSLARGWEKRIKTNQEAHDEEMEFARRFAKVVS